MKKRGLFLFVGLFIVASMFFVSAADTSAPSISLVQPSSDNVYFTWVGGVEVIIQTNEPADCWQSFRENNVKLDNPLYKLFNVSTEDGYFYSVTYGGLKDGANDYYIKCRDASGNVNSESFHGVITAGDNIEVDYVVSSLQEVEGDSYGVSLVIKNQGNKDAPRQSDAWVNVYGKDTEGKKLFLGQKLFEVPALKKGETFSYDAKNWLKLNSGEYTLWACSDTSKRIWESWANEDNNCKEVKFTLGGGAVGDDGKKDKDTNTNTQETSKYPLPFIFGNSVDVGIVYGAEQGVSAFELVEAQNIRDSLKNSYGKNFEEETLFKESDIDSVKSRNLIIVGRIGDICSNSVMKDVLGVNSCDSVKKELGISSGQYIIQSFENPWVKGKIALVVAGYSVSDVINASTYLRTNTVKTSVGSKFVGPNSAKTAACTDPDGRDHYKQGLTENQTGYVMYDFCIGDVWAGDKDVAEYYCDSKGNVVFENVLCDYGCSEGRCLDSEEAPAEKFCDDSDDGPNLYEIGGAEDGSGKKIEDACDSEGFNGMVREAICSDKEATYKLSSCPKDAPYCSAGRCTANAHDAEPVESIGNNVVVTGVKIDETVFDSDKINSNVQAAVGNAKIVNKKIVVFNKQGDYEVTVGKEARLLAVVPVTENVKVTLDSKTGEVLDKKNPWWGVLALDVSRKSDSLNESTLAVTIVDDKNSYDVGQEFSLEAKAAVKQVSSLSANWSVSIGCEITESTFGTPTGEGASQFLSLYAKGTCSQSGRKLVGVKIQGDSANQSAKDFSTILIN